MKNTKISPISFLTYTTTEPDDNVNFVREVDLVPYNGTFHDYAEAVLQFGYVNLFSAVSYCHFYLHAFCIIFHYFLLNILVYYFSSEISILFIRSHNY